MNIAPALSTNAMNVRNSFDILSVRYPTKGAATAYPRQAEAKMIPSNISKFVSYQ